MNVTPQQYAVMQKRLAPHSNSRVNIPTAFLVGGTICAIGQLLLEGFLRLGLERQAASGWVSVTLVVCSAILTGFGLYEKLARHAGAGTLVPITGFANAVTAAAMEAKTDSWCRHQSFHDGRPCDSLWLYCGGSVWGGVLCLECVLVMYQYDGAACPGTERSLFS